MGSCECEPMEGIDAGSWRTRPMSSKDLADASLTPRLQPECPQDLAPEYACELAALPLGAETAARRAKGVALMRGVLRAAATVAAATAK